ncbi:hypothetical protein [Kitasatospora humi]|nr:hypothetical protein [Kitasatospora humi]
MPEQDDFNDRAIPTVPGPRRSTENTDAKGRAPRQTRGSENKD